MSLLPTSTKHRETRAGIIALYIFGRYDGFLMRKRGTANVSQQ